MVVVSSGFMRSTETSEQIQLMCLRVQGAPAGRRPDLFPYARARGRVRLLAEQR